MASVNDIVLIHVENNPATYARVESISPDVKKDWFIIELMLLQLPAQKVSWILRDIYITGTEFAMGGKKMRIERIPPAREPETEDDQNTKEAGVISFAEHLKKK